MWASDPTPSLILLLDERNAIDPQRLPSPRSHPNIPNMSKGYVHGYDVRESTRLQDQATTLVDLLHSDTVFPAGSFILAFFVHIFQSNRQKLKR